MALPWGLVIFLFGFLYAVLVPGRQSKWHIFRSGILVGLILALVFILVGYTLDATPLGFEKGFLGFMLAAVVLSLLFVLGAWLGDVFEGLTRRTA